MTYNGPRYPENQEIQLVQYSIVITCVRIRMRDVQSLVSYDHVVGYRRAMNLAAST